MNNFVHYMDPSVTLEERLKLAFDELHLSDEQRESIMAFLNLLKLKDLETYNHSIRVALVARNIARFMHLDEKALFYPGLLHDMGKLLTSLKTLRKTKEWTNDDAQEMKKHVLEGYCLIRGFFDFTAEVIKWHHRFQIHGYPENVPDLLHHYSEGTKTMILMYGRLLSLADSYDAMHRINQASGGRPLSGQEIKERMLKLNPDQKILIEGLYNADIFTTHTVSPLANTA